MPACNGVQHKKNVWHGRDNIFLLRFDQILADLTRSPVDMDGVTRIRLEAQDSIGAITLLDAFRGEPYVNWWDETLSIGEVSFQLGEWAQIAGLSGLYACRLTVYDSNNVNGIVWVPFDRHELVINVIPVDA